MTTFKRDYKRELKGRYRATLQDMLQRVLQQLVQDAKLDARYRDHDLTGNWIGHCECRIKPDLLLVYHKPDPETLHLARLGSHSEIFGLSKPNINANTHFA